MWCIIGIATWKGVAFWMLFLLAGLEDIPKQYYEAASIDGAKTFDKFRFVTLPLLRRTILFVFVADTAANFVLMVPMIILTKGGPAYSSEVIGTYMYSQAFERFNVGYSSAIGTMMFFYELIIVGLFGVLRRLGWEV